jgi:hypothetical protein
MLKPHNELYVPGSHTSQLVLAGEVEWVPGTQKIHWVELILEI